MIRRLVASYRKRRDARHAIIWVMRIEEDRDAHEAGLRRWVGHSQTRADLYNRAWRGLHEASGPARRIYGDRYERGVIGKAARRIRPTQVLVVGFSLVGTAAVGVAVSFLHRSSQPITGVEVATDDYTTRVGEVRRIGLSDGTHIILDTNSVIRVVYRPGVRSVLLAQGRARFEVAHEISRPFVVTSGSATITDLGTTFDVDAYRDLKVQLIHGIVEVRMRFRQGNGLPPVRLTEGQQLRFDPDKPWSHPVPTSSDPTDAQWVTGMKTFDNAPLGAIVDEVNRYATTKIVLGDPALATHRVFLDLDIRDTKTVARNLAHYLHVELDDSQPYIVVLGSRSL